MSIFHKTAILVWIAFFVVSGCTGGTHVDEVEDAAADDESGRIESTVGQAVEDAREAEILALCVAETLFPVPDQVNGILHQLQAIRSAYGHDAVHKTRARNWWTGVIEVQFTAAADHEFEMGAYYHWNELNNELGLVGIEPTGAGAAALHFARRFNPCLGAEKYMELPGIVEASPLFVETDGPDVYMGMSEWYGYTYLFRYARGDCEHGCRDVEYYFFRFNGAEPVLTGRWNPAKSDPPAWWSQVEAEWIECSCIPKTLETPQETPPRARKKRTG
jgi:hypothetical protein